MRSGAGKGIGLTLLFACTVAVLAVGVAPASGPEPGPVSSALERAQPVAGAKAAAETTIFVVQGTSSANALNAFSDSSGRLVIASPQGIVEPDGPAPDCAQDSPTQVSCRAGYIGAVAGNLGGGSDTFTAQSTLSLLIGLSLASEERPMSGGPGNDRISGGLAGDLIAMGQGADTALGLGGGDLLRGEAGRDNLSGGDSSDNLIGGGGADKLAGGAARDLCHGGGGIDTAKSCNVTRKIP